ncbi:MAG: ABC transporter permease subunit [Clostridiaceae bacterium]|nr:ABC transporter permease subunit [Clostridiaceae bacterium]
MNRYVKDLLLKLWCGISGIMVLSTLSFIIIYIFMKGFSSINLDFIIGAPKGVPIGSEGGIYPAIIGSVYLMIIACVFATVLAISTAVYLELYCKNEKLLKIMHLVIHCTAGIPSIILGMFGYTFLVLRLGLGRSLMAGGITLGIMIFPFIEIRVEKILNEMDKNIVYASYALGLPKSYTFLKLLLPIYKRDIISTVLLAGGFAIGAAAPIILTAAVMYAPVPRTVLAPVMALPYHLYILIGEGISVENAYGTAFVLIVLLLTMNILPILNSLSRGGE